MGAQHCPLGLHALWGLRAAGLVGGRPWGGWPATVVRGVWCQDSRGSAIRVSWVRSVQAPRPSTGPTACALAGRRCSLWGWRKGVPGGDAFHRCEGRLRSSRDCPFTGRAVGVRHPRAVGEGVWVWGPSTVPLACMLCGGCVPWQWWGAVPGGGGLPPL